MSRKLPAALGLLGSCHPLPSEVRVVVRGPSPWSLGPCVRGWEAPSSPSPSAPPPPRSDASEQGPLGWRLPNETEDRVVRGLPGRSPPLYVSPIKPFKSVPATTLCPEALARPRPRPSQARASDPGAMGLLAQSVPCAMWSPSAGWGWEDTFGIGHLPEEGSAESRSYLRWRVRPQTTMPCLGPCLPRAVPWPAASQGPGARSPLPPGASARALWLQRAGSEHQLGPGLAV